MSFRKNIKEILPRGLIVSCQALDNEPLHSSFIMSKMALAAKTGGAIGIRANTKEDITAIKKEVSLPVIGIVKRDFTDSAIYITPTMDEIDELVESGTEIIALDATDRLRPGEMKLSDFVKKIRNKYPHVYLMADISNYDEGLNANCLGFDLIATTLAGYTPYTEGRALPDIELLKKLKENIKVPIIAEGGISTPEMAALALSSGAYSIVVGGAITRPQLITKSFVDALTFHFLEKPV